MCVDALHKTSTNRSYVCLFAAPYEAQIRAIFDRISQLLALSPAVESQEKKPLYVSPAVKEMVISNTKTPFEIKFRNGSAIRGFTTGAGTGNGAVSFRGQRADSLYLDESDYMSDADFDSILAIAGEREGIRVN